MQSVLLRDSRVHQACLKIEETKLEERKELLFFTLSHQFSHLSSVLEAIQPSKAMKLLAWNPSLQPAHFREPLKAQNTSP